MVLFAIPVVMGVTTIAIIVLLVVCFHRQCKKRRLRGVNNHRYDSVSTWLSNASAHLPEVTSDAKGASRFSLPVTIFTKSASSEYYKVPDGSIAVSFDRIDPKVLRECHQKLYLMESGTCCLYDKPQLVDSGTYLYETDSVQRSNVS